MIGPCETPLFNVGMINAVFNGFAILLTAWLVHRRKRADRRERAFIESMLVMHGMDPDEWKKKHIGRPRGNGQ